MYKHIRKVEIELFQGSAVTQTTSGGLTIYPPVANFLWCIHCKCQKLLKLAGSRQSYCKNYQAYFFVANPVDTVSVELLSSVSLQQ